MTKPIISVISPAINANYWGEFYHYFTIGNFIPWEIVFVGPKAPDFPLPENFRHIQVNFKLTQCLEIAAMEARGEYLVIIPDDVIVLPGVLDWAHLFKNRLPPFSIVGVRYGKDVGGERKELNDKCALIVSDLASPVIPICGMIRKSEWVELGGIDSQFVVSCGDMDLYMRAFARGGCPFISPDSVIFEREVAAGGTRITKKFRHDYYLVVDQWTNRDANGIVIEYRKQRKDPIIPFDHETIMDYDQGNMRGWIL